MLYLLKLLCVIDGTAGVYTDTELVHASPRGRDEHSGTVFLWNDWSLPNGRILNSLS